MRERSWLRSEKSALSAAVSKEAICICGDVRTVLRFLAPSPSFVGSFFLKSSHLKSHLADCILATFSRGFSRLFFSVSVQMRGFFNSIQFPLIREFRYPKAKKLVINVYTDTYVGDRGGVYHRYPRDMVGTWRGASRCVCRDFFLHHRKHFLRSLALFLHVFYFGRLYFAC